MKNIENKILYTILYYNIIFLFLISILMLSFFQIYKLYYDINNNTITKQEKIKKENIYLDTFYFNKETLEIGIIKQGKLFKNKIEYDISYIYYMWFILLLISIWSFIIYEIVKKSEEEKFLLKASNLESLATQNSMSVLTENIHHELNSPISVITLKINKIQDFIWCYMLEKTGYNVDIKKAHTYLLNKTFILCGKEFKYNDIKEHFDLIQTSIDQTKTILANMSDFKQLKYSNGNKNIFEIINGAIKMLKVVSDTEFNIDIDKNLKNYKLNHSTGIKNADLISIFINFFKNSLDANATKIKVFIDKIEDNYVYIIIEDNGNGIEKNILKDIFKPDKSSKSDTIGLRGNGLFLVQNLLRVFGGDVKLKRTEIYKGTEFIIKIPIVID